MPLLAERQEENYIFRTQSLQIGTFVEGTSALIFLWPHSLLPPPSAVLLSPQVWAKRWAVPSGFSSGGAVRVAIGFVCVWKGEQKLILPEVLCVRKTASCELFLCATQLLWYFSMPTSPLALLLHLLKSDKQLSVLYLVWVRAQEESRKLPETWQVEILSCSLCIQYN